MLKNLRLRLTLLYFFGALFFIALLAGGSYYLLNRYFQTTTDLALKYRLTLGRLEELIGKRLDPIHIIGGGTKNRLLNQLTADCTGRTIVAGPVEATAIGNVLLQAIARGQLGSLAEGRALVRRSFAVESYSPNRVAEWDEAMAKLSSLTHLGLS